MILYFLDKDLTILGTASNTLPNGIQFIADEEIIEVENGSTSFDFTLLFDSSTRKTCETLAELGNYVIFADDGDTESSKVFTIVDTELSTGDGDIEIYAESAGLELLNGIVGEFAAEEAHDIEWYINKFISGDSEGTYDDFGFTIGTNEVGTETTKTLDWTGSTTIAKRLLSIADNFDAEISFSFELSRLTITAKKINIYNQIGSETDIRLRMSKEISDIRIKKSLISNFATVYDVSGGTPEGTPTESKANLITYATNDANDDSYITYARQSSSGLNKFYNFDINEEVSITTLTTAGTTWGSGFSFSSISSSISIPYNAGYIASIYVYSPVEATIKVDVNNTPASGSTWNGNDNDNTSKRSTTSFTVPATKWTRLSWTVYNNASGNSSGVALIMNDSVGMLPQSADVTWKYKCAKVTVFPIAYGVTEDLTYSSITRTFTCATVGSGWYFLAYSKFDRDELNKHVGEKVTFQMSIKGDTKFLSPTVSIKHSDATSAKTDTVSLTAYQTNYRWVTIQGVMTLNSAVDSSDLIYISGIQLDSKVGQETSFKDFVLYVGEPYKGEDPIRLDDEDRTDDTGKYKTYASTGYLYSTEAIEKFKGKINNGIFMRAYSYDTLDRDELFNRAVTDLKKHDHAETTYEAEVFNYTKALGEGDVVNVIDETGELYLRARILKIKKSRSEGTRTITLGDYEEQ